MNKLEIFNRGLKRWANQFRYSIKEKKEELTLKLVKLLKVERNDETLADLIDTKIQLNFEIEKDERYWEQRARVNWLKFASNIETTEGFYS